MGCNGLQWVAMGLQWVAMGLQWFAVGLQWVAMGCDGLQWLPSVRQGNLVARFTHFFPTAESGSPLVAPGESEGEASKCLIVIL